MSDLRQEARPAAGWRPSALMLGMAATGAAAGLALRVLFDDPDELTEPLRLAASVGVVTLAAAIILLQDVRRPAAAALFGAGAALLFALLTWWRVQTGGAFDDGFAGTFWLLLGWPLCGYLSFTLAAAALERRTLRPPYSAVFRHAVSGPVAAALGALTAGAMIGFLALWGEAFEMMQAEPLKRALQSSWVLMPAGGAAGAVGATFALQDSRLRGVGEAILLIGARILLPMVAVFSALFAVLLPVTGIEGLRAGMSPSGLLLAITLGAVLAFNGVYRDGAVKPGAVLRWPARLALAVLPVLTLTALYGVLLRTGDSGLTPARVVAGAAALIASLYALGLLAALASELFRLRGAARWDTAVRWMPPVARLNIGFALAWLVTLVLMQTPLLDPLGLSARDQEWRLRTGEVSATQFDYAALQFRMGLPGRAALERIEAWDAHPELAEIREQVDFAQAAPNYYYALPDAVQAMEVSPLPDEALRALADFDAGLTDDARAIEAIAAERRATLDALDCALRAMPMDETARSTAAFMLGERRYALSEAPQILRRAIDPATPYENTRPAPDCASPPADAGQTPPSDPATSN